MSFPLNAWASITSGPRIARRRLDRPQHRAIPRLEIHRRTPPPPPTAGPTKTTLNPQTPPPPSTNPEPASDLPTPQPTANHPETILTQQLGVPRTGATHQDQLLMWCINLESKLTVLKNLKVTSAYTQKDTVTFQDLRVEYYKTRGWWRMWFSLYTISRIKFVKVYPAALRFF